jgi:saccharopine dehydrogenase (NAD+, L-lysine-forming)
MHLWLRAESKPFEARTPLTPEGARLLVEAGHRVTVERSSGRTFSDDEYQGVAFAETGSWPEAPRDAVILGLKELPVSKAPLVHRHVMFAHCYKEQAGWRELLARFVDGGGVLYDLEVLESEGRRVAAFGYWAGYAGAAVGALVAAGKRGAIVPSPSRAELVRALGDLPRPKSVLVVGAKGRCGRGARALCDDVGIDAVTEWDLEETRGGGPFAAILEHELFVNAVLLAGAMPPFLTREMLERPRRLRVVSDVSCDPTSPYNPIPIYAETTTFAAPACRVVDDPPLDVVAIDHLPSLLPRESSEDFAAQLFPHLARFAESEVWRGAERVFRHKTEASRSS